MAEFYARNVTELVDKINAANANPDADIINLLPEGIFSFTTAASNPINYGANALPVINSDITINGNFATIERSTSAPNFRIFLVSGPGGPAGTGLGKLTLQNVTVRNGSAPGGLVGEDGGALLNVGGTVAIKNSTFTNNVAIDDGGAIVNVATNQSAATMTIDNSLIYGNKTQGLGAGDGGGGIENDGNRDGTNITTPGAVLTIKNSTISSNTVVNGDAGGIRNRDGATLTIEDSTIAFNISSTGNGNGIANGSQNNVPAGVATTVTLKNTIVAGNGTSGNNIVNAPFGQSPATVTSLSNNIVGSNNANISPNNTNINNIISTTLANNGGATQSYNLVTGSPALVASGGTAGAKDQRGADTQSRNDIGAIKLVSAPPAIKVTLPDNTNILDGTFIPIAIPDSFLNTTSVTNFKIRNDGQQNLTLSGLTITGTGFSQGTGFGSTTLAPGQETTFGLSLNTTSLGNYNGKIAFNTNVLGRETFDFDISAIVKEGKPAPSPTPSPTPTPTPTPLPQRLTIDGDSIFVVGSNNGETNLSLSLVGKNTRFINELGVVKLDGNNKIAGTNIGFGDSNFRKTALTKGKVIYSVIPDAFVSGVEQILDGFSSGDRLLFYLVSNASFDGVLGGRFGEDKILFASPLGGNSPGTQVQDLGNGEFNLGWRDQSDASFNKLTVKLKQTGTKPVLGTGLQSGPQGELLDLRSLNTRSARIETLGSEAKYNNTVGLCRVDLQGNILDPITGSTVTDGNIGSSTYKQSILKYQLGNSAIGRSSTAIEIQLPGGGIYAPFIIANNNTDNIYVPFLGANPNQTDHIRLLGPNTFGFEDLPNGGDMDYNDFVFKVTIS